MAQHTDDDVRTTDTHERGVMMSCVNAQNCDGKNTRTHTHTKSECKTRPRLSKSSRSFLFFGIQHRFRSGRETIFNDSEHRASPHEDGSSRLVR